MPFNLIIGEPMKDKFEGITLVDAATESSYVKSNGIFTAVCPFFIEYSSRSPGNQAVVESLQFSKPTITRDLRLIFL